MNKSYQRVAMRPLLLLLGLFIVTVLAVAIYLVVTNGPSRIAAAGTTCPQATVPNYSRPFLPDQEIPDLCEALNKTPAQAVTYILRRSIPVRTYIATEIQQECRYAQSGLCVAHLGDAILESAIDSRLDAILPRVIQDSHNFTSADISTTLPFPWSGFTALRSDISPYASLSFEMPRGTLFTRRRVEEQYGLAQQQETDAQGYLSLKYSNAGNGYTSKITALIDPITTEVRRIIVSVAGR